jgi:cytochrome c-type biogenesis protein CcmH/NrfF
MRPWRSSLVLFAPLTNADVRRVGETLRCMCGCSYTVTSCNMLNCSGVEQARAMLLELVRKGLSDDEIRAEFVKIHGPVVESEKLKRYREQIEEDFSKLD